MLRLIPHARPFLAAGFGLVALAGVATVYMAKRAADADGWIAHTLKAKEAATRLVGSLEEAQSSKRGFLVTAGEDHLEDYNRAKAAVSEAMAELRELTADNVEQQELLRRLRVVIDEWQGFSEHTIALVQNGRHDEAIAAIGTGRGRELMRRLTVGINTFSGRESGLLAERQNDKERYDLWLVILICSSLATAACFAAILAVATDRSVQQLRTRTAELEAEIKLRQETEATLRQVQKMEAVGHLTGGIAHDFNNLLTIVLGNLDTMERRLSKLSLVKEGRELVTPLLKPLDAASRGARSASDLTYRLLAFSRQQPLKPARLDLNRLISGMSEFLRRTLDETVKMETVLCGGLWPAFADASQVENTLVNLCINARDAMPKGGALTIETANVYLDHAYAKQFGDVCEGQYVMLSVADTGTGIAPEIMPKIFEPFFTTKAPGMGTGLGLAMVYGFAKQSGGHIRVYSELGHGTTVKIYLPRLAETQQLEAVPLALAEAMAPFPQALPDETILVVEDNREVRSYAKSVLEELGYRVIESGEAAGALRVLEGGGRVDLLFTDVVLPDINGRELCDRARAIHTNLPVLFTTGYTRNAIIHQGRLDAGVHLLSKPYTRRDLARYIRELLDAKSVAPLSVYNPES